MAIRSRGTRFGQWPMAIRSRGTRFSQWLMAIRSRDTRFSQWPMAIRRRDPRFGRWPMAIRPCDLLSMPGADESDVCHYSGRHPEREDPFRSRDVDLLRFVFEELS